MFSNSFIDLSIITGTVCYWCLNCSSNLLQFYFLSGNIHMLSITPPLKLRLVQQQDGLDPKYHFRLTCSDRSDQITLCLSLWIFAINFDGNMTMTLSKKHRLLDIILCCLQVSQNISRDLISFSVFQVHLPSISIIPNPYNKPWDSQPYLFTDQTPLQQLVVCV